jgi:branched-chain amino acid transport system substrate-binding protein
MDMRLRKFTIPLLMLAVGMLWGAPGTRAAEPIKIGLTISTTGSFAFASSQGFKGVEIWADEVNRAGGLDVGGVKRPVKLIYYDDRSDKQTVVRLYEKLITDDKVDVAFGPFGSTLTGAAASITEKHHKLLIIWSAASDAVYDQGFKYIVSATQTPASLLHKPAADDMAALGVKTLAMVFVDQPFPVSVSENTRKIAESLGIKVVAFEKYASGTKDFTILLQKIARLHPDAFYTPSYLDDEMVMMRQMKEANLNFKYIFMNYAGQPQWNELGPDGWYAFGVTLYHKKLNWKVNAGMNRAEFEKAYYEKFPNAKLEPDFQTSLAYGAGVMLGEFIKNAGSTDSKAVKQAALELSGKRTVMTGPYAIDGTGKQKLMPFSIIQVQPTKGYEVELVWPKEVATAKPIYPIPPWSQR